VSLWRKRKTSDTNCDTIAQNVHHNGQNQPKWANMTALANNDLSIKSEQKQDNLPSPLDRLHEENVRLGLYEIVYDLSIQSDDLSIKSEEAMREVQRLGQEIQGEHMIYEDIKDFYQRCEEHPDHQSGMISNSMIQQRLHEEIDELREYIEQKLKEKNT